MHEPLTLVAVRRVFSYNGRDFQDPDPAMTPESVRDFYAHIHPELTSAVVELGEFSGDTQAYTFKRAVGTKG